MTQNHAPSMSSPETPTLSQGQMEALFRRLNLAHSRRIYQQVADRAEKENWSYRDFLALLLAEEVAHRNQTRLQRFTRKAHFPFFKTIDEFDFSLQTSLRQSLLGSYLGPDFVTEGRSLILYGKAYTRPHVLLCDEIGYLSYGPDAANVLFHVVNERHLRKRPMIFTTNKPLTQWGKVLHDQDLAAAILDRILERGRFVHLGGPSGRTRHLNLGATSPSEADRLRISGTHT